MNSPSQLSVEVRQETPIPLDVQFTCDANQVLAIFGPSGSGKTTVLRAIAGLHRPVHAKIQLGQDVWTDTGTGRHVPTHERRVGFVFQDYALFPHMTARGNVAAALGHHSRGERQRATGQWLAAVRLTGLEERRPAELSGGQRQRVALARALARDPHVLLLDEPFAAVDRATRRQLHDDLDELRRRAGLPVLLVTHDFQDVVRLATHVVLLDRGRSVAAGPIADLTNRPDGPWTTFLGDAGSVIDVQVQGIDRDRGLAELAFGGEVLFVPHDGLTVGTTVRLRVPAREVILARLRPQGLSLHNILKGTVSRIATTADDHLLLQVRIGEHYLLAEVTRDAVQRLSLALGSDVFALIKSVAIQVHSRTPERLV